MDEEETSPTVALAVDETLALLSRGSNSPGSKLPGERSLATSIGVSRTTVRAALRKLEHEGVIEGHPQRGWFIRKAKSVSDRSTELQSFTEIARQRGFTPSSDILVSTRRTASMDEADELEIPPASPIIQLTRLRKLDGIPICIDESILVARLCENVLNSDLTTGSLYDALHRDCGVAVYRSSCTLQAKSASAEQAKMLALETGDPVLEVSARTTTVDGTTVLSSVQVYRGDSYRFQAELFRASPFA